MLPFIPPGVAGRLGTVQHDPPPEVSECSRRPYFTGWSV